MEHLLVHLLTVAKQSACDIAVIDKSFARCLESEAFLRLVLDFEDWRALGPRVCARIMHERALPALSRQVRLQPEFLMFALQNRDAYPSVLVDERRIGALAIEPLAAVMHESLRSGILLPESRAHAEFWRIAKHALLRKAVLSNSPTLIVECAKIVRTRKNRFCAAKYLRWALAEGKHRVALQLLVMTSGQLYMHEHALDDMLALDELSLSPRCQGVAHILETIVRSNRAPRFVSNAKLYREKCLFVALEAWFHMPDKSEILGCLLELLNVFVQRHSNEREKKIFNVLLSRALKHSRERSVPCAPLLAGIFEWHKSGGGDRRFNFMFYTIRPELHDKCLYKACKEGASAEHVRALYRDGSRDTALNHAVRANAVSAVQALLDSSSQLRKRKHVDTRPLIKTAASYGHREVLRHLILERDDLDSEYLLDALIDLGSHRSNSAKRVKTQLI